MKELSIEQKAKAYDEALKKARQLCCYPTTKPFISDLQDLFPELQESEDEMIRKAIIDFFSEPGRKEYILNGFTVDGIIAWLEKQGEQKPADKVEPKFHKGDWVVTSYGKVNQVIAVDEDCDGFTLDDDTYFSGSWKDGYHLWTIKDAKDGDVLATQNYIYIFNSIDKETETVAFYCLIKKSDKHFSFGDYRIHDEILNSTPATKKQYDILIKAMTDAGYTFDFKEKELKKIEDEEYNGEDYGIDSLYHAQRILEKTLGEVEGYQSDDGILDHKAAITAVKKLYKQKPWSVEDMSKVQRICKYLDEAKKYYADITEVRECIDWLKSLKSRVIPQSKQEWSEEDEDYFDAIITKLEVTQEDAALTDNQLKFLKSLKYKVFPQNTWKPSDEQIEALGVATDICSIPEKQYDELNKLYYELKKLKT